MNYSSTERSKKRQYGIVAGMITLLAGAVLTWAIGAAETQIEAIAMEAVNSHDHDDKFDQVIDSIDRLTFADLGRQIIELTRSIDKMQMRKDSGNWSFDQQQELHTKINELRDRNIQKDILSKKVYDRQ